MAAAAFVALGTEVSAIGFSQEELRRCFAYDKARGEVCFAVDTALWKLSAGRVSVAGSFNGWTKDAPGYAMSLDGGCWVLALPASKLSVPGASGRPEFKFAADGEYLTIPDFVPEGYRFGNRNDAQVLSLDGRDAKKVKHDDETASERKTVSDFELTGRRGKREISNFRPVPGALYLFRSYHPFKASFTENSSEIYRLKFASGLAEEAGVKSDICLSGDETGDLRQYDFGHSKLTESIPDYYRSIIASGNVLYVGQGYAEPSYEEVYYNSGGELMCLWVKDIVDFIIDEKNPVPFSIHCRLGTDRTGVFSAILAGLCGAEWEDIAEDYEQSNAMGIGEFRSRELLKYSLDGMLGRDVEEIEDLKAALSAYFIGRGALTEEKINALADRLK